MSAQGQQPSRRQLSTLDCIGIGINGIIGSGIFFLPQTVFRLAGGRSPLAWLIVGGLCFLVGLCFAEASSYSDRSGGPYNFARLAFGDTLGYAVGFVALASIVLSYAAVARGFTEQLAWFVPTVAGREVLVGAVVIGLLGAANLGGVKPGAWTSDAFSAAKLLPLLALVGAGIWLVDGSRLLAPPAPHPGEHAGLIPAAMAGLFACTGFEFVTVPAGETRNPARAIPIALLGSLAGAVVLYALVQLVAVGVNPALGESHPALAETARRIGGARGGDALVLAALVSAIGFCSGSALVGPRYVAAFADDGMAPRILARRLGNGTPAVAIAVFTAAAAVLGNLGDFQRLADISNIAVVAQYLPTCAAVLVLRRRRARSGAPRPEGFRLPFGPLIPVVALGGCVAFLSSVKPAEARVCAGVVLVGFVLRGALLVARRFSAAAG